MVLVASIIVFCHYSYFLGPALVGIVLRLLRYRPSPRSRMDEDLVQLRVRGVGDARRHRLRFSSPRPLARRHNPRSWASVLVCASAAYLGLNAVFVAFAVAVVNNEAYSHVLRELLCLQRRSPSLCVPGARSRLGLSDARRRGGSPSGRADLDRPVDVRELLRAEGGSGADHRDADPRAGGEGPVHRRSRAARRHVLRVRRRRVRVRRTPHGAAPLRGAHARHRQARRAQPAAQQARSADRVGVRTGEAPRAGVGRAAAPHRLPRAGRRRHDHRSGHRRGRRHRASSSRRSSTWPTPSTP